MGKTYLPLSDRNEVGSHGHRDPLNAALAKLPPRTAAAIQLREHTGVVANVPLTASAEELFARAGQSQAPGEATSWCFRYKVLPAGLHVAQIAECKEMEAILEMIEPSKRESLVSGPSRLVSVSPSSAELAERFAYGVGELFEWILDPTISSVVGPLDARVLGIDREPWTAEQLTASYLTGLNPMELTGATAEE